MSDTGQFAHMFYPDDVSEGIERAPQDILAEIDQHAIVPNAILAELEGPSPTITAMMKEAKDAYVEAMRQIVEINPFESETEKARFIRVQHEARRFRDLLDWLHKHALAYRKWHEWNQDAEVQRIRREAEQDDRPTE